MNALELDELTDLLADCYDDPDLFNTAVLQRPNYWASWESPEPQYPGQVEWCEALVEYHTLAIETGNMLGKDYFVAGIVPWWLYTRPNSLVIVTGPGQTAIGSVTWKEIRRAAESSPLCPYPLAARISEGIKASPSYFEIAPGHHALGFSTTTVERASGQHAGDMLVIVEEASGVEDHAWESIDSYGATKIVAIGNPLRAEGGFARLCDQGDEDYRNGVPSHKAIRHLNVPSTASPHALLEQSPVGLASANWLEQMVRKWGADSLWVQTHIRAKRPAVSAAILIPVEWLDYAFKQHRKPVGPDHPIHKTRRLACDLGEGVGRDSSCVLVRDDWGVLDCRYGSQLGLPEAASLMAQMGKDWSIPGERMTFDKLGIGRKMPNHLAKYGLGDAKPYSGSGSPRDPQFSNLRSECAWRLHQRLDPVHVPDIRSPFTRHQPFTFCAGLYQDKLRTQIKPLTYFLSGTKTAILAKDDWTDVLGASPDIADTLIQSFYCP